MTNSTLPDNAVYLSEREIGSYKIRTFVSDHGTGDQKYHVMVLQSGTLWTFTPEEALEFGIMLSTYGGGSVLHQLEKAKNPHQ